MIHEYEIVFIVESLFKRLFSALCGVGFDKCIAQKFCLNKKVRGIIIDNEYSCITRGEFLPILSSEALISSLFEIEFSDFLTFGFSLRNLNYKGRALGVNTVDGNSSVHSVNQLLNYRQTKACSLDIFVLILIHSLECGKQIRDILFLDSGSRISNRISHGTGIVINIAVSD